MPYIIPENLNSQSKIVVDDMCDFLSKNSKKLFGYKPFEISRDRDGHILLFEHDKENANIYCHTIGYNKISKTFTDYVIGEIGYLPRGDDHVIIMRVAMHPAFQSKGIGRIMYQASENLFVTKGVNYVELCSLVTYKNINDYLEESIEDIVNKYGYSDGQDYIRKNFYDTNLFFYRSLGFIPITRMFATSVSLKKDDLEYTNIKYGIKRINRNAVKFLSLPLDKIVPEEVDVYEYLENHRPSLLFDLELNNYPSEEFHPIEFPATMSGYEKLLKTLTQGSVAKNSSQPIIPCVACSNYHYNESENNCYKTIDKSTKNQKMIDELLLKLQEKIDSLEETYNK